MAHFIGVSKPVEKQSETVLLQKLEKAKKTLLPSFKTWQPYGVLLKLAQLYKADPSDQITIENFGLIEHNINLIAAPELSDIEPIIDTNKSCFKQSAECYKQATFSDRQYILNCIKRYNFLRAMQTEGLPHGAFERSTRQPPEQFLHQLQRYTLFHILI